MARIAWGKTSLFGVVVVAAMTTIGACSSDNSGKNSAGSNASAVGGTGALKPAATAARAGVGAPLAAQGTISYGANVPTTPASSSGAASLVAGYQIRTVDITVSLKKAADVAVAANRAGDIAAKYGGEVFGDDRTSGTDASAQIILKVPPDSLSNVLRDLSALGAEKSRSESTKDVTADVIDVDTRVKKLQDAINALGVLFHRPNLKLSDIIQLENELSQREADLESLQSQQRALHAQTDTASVTLLLVTQHVVAKAKPHHKKAGGFVGGLRDGWHAFAKSATWCAKALGALVPFAVLLVAIGFGARLLWPRLSLRRRMTPAPAPTTE